MGPRAPPRAFFCAGWVCWHPETIGANAAYQCKYEVVEFGCAAKAPDKLQISVGLPPMGPRAPPGALICAGLVCWHPETLGAHAAYNCTSRKLWNLAALLELPISS